MDWHKPWLCRAFDALERLQERLPRSLAWIVFPFLFIVFIVEIAEESLITPKGLRVILRIAVPLLLAGWLGELIVNQLSPDTEATAMLLLLGLVVCHLYQTESLRARITRLDSDIEGALIELNEAVRAVTREIETE